MKTWSDLPSADFVAYCILTQSNCFICMNLSVCNGLRRMDWHCFKQGIQAIPAHRQSRRGRVWPAAVRGQRATVRGHSGAGPDSGATGRPARPPYPVPGTSRRHAARRPRGNVLVRASLEVNLNVICLWLYANTNYNPRSSISVWI